MSRWHRSMPHVAKKVLPYLEALRDRLSIPMIFVSHQFDEVLRLATHVVAAGSRARSRRRDRPSEDRPGARALRAIVGPEAVGAVLDGVVTSIDADRKLAELRVGGGTLRISSRDLRFDGRRSGSRRARSAAGARHHPGHRTAARAERSQLDCGRRRRHCADDEDAVLVRVDIGGETVLSRITTAAAEALQLQRGSQRVGAHQGGVDARARLHVAGHDSSVLTKTCRKWLAWWPSITRWSMVSVM